MRLKTLTLPALMALAGSVNAQLFNAGFEDPVKPADAPFVGNWNVFTGSGAGVIVGNSALLAQTGASSLGLTIDSVANTFGGAFQDVPNVVPGVSYNFSGWHASPSGLQGVAVEIRIEWRDSATQTPISSTPNLSPVPSALFGAFSVIGEAPAGADTARVLYAIQSFVGGPDHFAVVHLDDTSFTAVPEPGVYALLSGVGLAAFAVIRRRSRAWREGSKRRWIVCRGCGRGRYDWSVGVPAVKFADMSRARPGEPSAVVRQRVIEAIGFRSLDRQLWGWMARSISTAEGESVVGVDLHCALLIGWAPLDTAPAWNGVATSSSPFRSHLQGDEDIAAPKGG
jgi:hypothetical protein